MRACQSRQLRHCCRRAGHGASSSSRPMMPHQGAVHSITRNSANTIHRDAESPEIGGNPTGVDRSQPYQPSGANSDRTRRWHWATKCSDSQIALMDQHCSGNKDRCESVSFPAKVRLHPHARLTRTASGAPVSDAVRIMHRPRNARAAPYLTFASTQSAMTPAISRLFFSNIIIWPLPWMPRSPSLIQSLVTPARVRNCDVHWS